MSEMDDTARKAEIVTVDQIEESSSFIGNGSGDESFTGSGWSVKEDATRRLDTDCFEKLRVAKRELDHLFDQSKLLATTSDVVVSDGVQSFLFFLLEET